MLSKIGLPTVPRAGGGQIHWTVRFAFKGQEVWVWDTYCLNTIIAALTQSQQLLESLNLQENVDRGKALATCSWQFSVQRAGSVRRVKKIHFNQPRPHVTYKNPTDRYGLERNGPRFRGGRVRVSKPVTPVGTSNFARLITQL